MADPNFLRGNEYFNLFPAGMTPPNPRAPGLFGYNTGNPSGSMEGILQSIMPMVAEMLRSQYGVRSFTFGSDMNVASADYARQFIQQLNAARQAAAPEDAVQLNSMMRGVARMLGHDLNDPTTLKSIGVLSNDMSQMLPFLAAAFPDHVDRFMPRGSMTVAAASFASAGRYVMDPMTGTPVTFADPTYGVRIAGDLVRGGPQVTAGLGAGRLGQMYEALVAQGLTPGGADLRQQVGLNVAGGLAGIELGMSGDEARNIQSDRTKKVIANYAGAIAAINDIFAEQGHPNSSMASLIKGLQTLTQGGLGNYDPTTLASTVRRFQSINQMTGMGYEQMAALGQMVGGELTGRGFRTGAAPEIVARAALMGQVYRDSGLIFGGSQGMSLNDVVLGTAQLQTAGHTSDYASLIGAVLAMSASAPEGSPIKALADDIKAGRADKLTNIQFSTIDQMARASGFGAGALQMQLNATNQVKAALQDNARGADLVIGAQQAQHALENFARMPSARLVGLNFKDMYDAIQDSVAAGGFTDDVGLANLAAGRLGIGKDDVQRRFHLATAIGQAGGWARFTSVNTTLQMREFEKRTEADEIAENYRALQHLMRGTGGRHVAEWLTRIGDIGLPAGPVLNQAGHFLARGWLGGVAEDDVTDAKFSAKFETGLKDLAKQGGLFHAFYQAAPFAALVNKMLGRGGDFGAGGDFDRAPIDVLGIDSTVGPFSKFAADAFHKSRDAKGGAGGPQSVNISGPQNVTIAVQQMTLITDGKGGGTITTGGAKVAGS